jgi:phosphoglucosamine mutase
MTKQYFGTDGIRGRVGDAPITPEFVLKLGWAAGKVLAGTDGGKVLIGKDTRISGYMFESALQAGLSAAGVDIGLLGPMPTPGIAYLTRTFHARAGIVISASHNPYYDNGIKFFSSSGTKLADEIEHAIEAELDKPVRCNDSAQLGKAVRINDAAGRYIEFCKSTFPKNQDLRGLKMVIDCANGATYHIAPSVFTELGATVITLADQPDGFNINANVGSTHPNALQAAVKAEKADLGIAFDGDGDRVLMVDNMGQLIDGDELLYIIAMHRKAQSKLYGGVVGTLMTNLGLEHAFERAGISFERVGVGDRYVMEKLIASNWLIGGENSGHIICLDRTTTGDGIVAVLQVLAALIDTGKSLTELLSNMTKYPQTLINVHMEKKRDVVNHPNVQVALKAAEQKLANTGRILLRPSGTEPLIRVMVEGQDAGQVDSTAQELVSVVENVLKS